MLSGIRREKEAPDGLDIEDYSRDLENSDRAGEGQRQLVRRHQLIVISYRAGGAEIIQWPNLRH
jgi:hypothetical protein